MKTKFLASRFFIIKYSCSSLKTFKNKVDNKGKTELTTATHDIHILLTANLEE